jgi:hypothetical protein
MATRRLRIALWRHHRHLQRQAAAQESAVEHLIVLADTLHTAGRPQAAQCLVKVALRFRVKAICLSAQAETLNWRTGLFV